MGLPERQGVGCKRTAVRAVCRARRKVAVQPGGVRESGRRGRLLKVPLSAIAPEAEAARDCLNN